MPTRKELFQLVESLPEGAIDAAHQTLTRLQVWPPPPPPGREEALERFRQNQARVEQRMRERMKPGECFVGFVGEQWLSERYRNPAHIVLGIHRGVLIRDVRWQDD
jgi:hypothetical protein